MQIDKFYKAQDLLRMINIIETVINAPEINDSTLDKLDQQMKREIKADVSAYVKTRLKEMKAGFEKEFEEL